MRTPKFWGRLATRKQSGKGTKDARPADSPLRRQVLAAVLGGATRAAVESLLRWLFSLL